MLRNTSKVQKHKQQEYTDAYYRPVSRMRQQLAVRQQRRRPKGKMSELPPAAQNTKTGRSAKGNQDNKAGKRYGLCWPEWKNLRLILLQIAGLKYRDVRKKGDAVTASFGDP